MYGFAVVEEVSVFHSLSHWLQLLSTYFLLGTVWDFPKPQSLHCGIKTDNNIVMPFIEGLLCARHWPSFA